MTITEEEKRSLIAAIHAEEARMSASRGVTLRDADITFYRPEIKSSEKMAFPFLPEAVRLHPSFQGTRHGSVDDYFLTELKNASFAEQSRAAHNDGKRVMTAAEVLEKRVQHGRKPEVQRFLRELPYMSANDLRSSAARAIAPDQKVLPSSVHETMCQDEALRWFTQLHTRSAIRVQNYIRWHQKTFPGESFPSRIKPTPTSALVLFIPDCYTLAKLVTTDMPFDAANGGFLPDGEYTETEAGIFRCGTTDAYVYRFIDQLFKASGLDELFKRQWECANWLTHNGSLMWDYRTLLREIDPLRQTAASEREYYSIPAFLTEGITPLVLGGVPSPLQSAFAGVEVFDPKTKTPYIIGETPAIQPQGIVCGVRYPGERYHEIQPGTVTFATMFCGDARLSAVATIPDKRHGEIRRGMPQVR